jgi:prepilin-type N-terminal cleavage/methylation domain-containing protein
MITRASSFIEQKEMENPEGIRFPGRRSNCAFTLVELLVVISIIGLLAALVVPLAGVATTKMRVSRVKSELGGLVTAIETYKLETGEYPPDNAALKNMSTTDRDYPNALAMNPLFYELTGAIFTNRPTVQYVPVAFGTPVTSTDLKKAFNLSGIRNSARAKADIEYKGFSIRASQHATVSNNVEILTVPVPGPISIPLTGNKIPGVTPWFYDASSTNRHNLNGFDLWAEVNLGRETNIIGNWKN